MKKNFGLFVFPLMAAMSLVGCKKEPTPETPKITINGATEWGVHGTTTYTSSVEGVTWTSSNTSVATISESGQLLGLSAGTTTLTAAKEGYESATIAVSIIENPYSFTEEQLGFYAGIFKGASGSLDVQGSAAGYQDGESVKTIYPTKIVDEQHSYKINGGVEEQTINETYKVLYFESKFNDTDYRLRFTESEFKHMLLEKKIGENFVKIDEYHPTGFAPFTGSYNGFDGSLSEYNTVYIFSDNEYDAGEGHIGYTIKGYHESTGQLSEIEFMNELGYQTLRGENGATSYVLGFETFDLSDREYFEGVNVLSATSSNLLYAGSETVSWYADPTPFFTEIVNEDGEKLSNSYSEAETGYDFSIDGEDYSCGVTRDSEGLKFVCNDDEKETYEVRIGSEFSYKVGETTKKFGLSCTLLEPAWYEESLFENADNSSTFEYWWDIDWDTYDDVLVLKYNGNDLQGSDLSTSVVGDGFVSLKFSFEEKEVTITKITEALLTVSVDGRSEKFVSASTINELFSDSFTNGIMELSVDTSAHKITLNESEIDVNFFYSESWNRVVAHFLSYTLVQVDKDIGFYMMFADDDSASYTLLTESKYTSLFAQYTNDGVNIYEFDAEGLSVNGQSVSWMLTAFTTATDIIPAIMFQVESYVYALIPGFNKTMGLYSVLSGGRLELDSTLVDKNIGDSFIGKYLCETQYGVETIEFNSSYEFYADIYNEQSHELVPTKFDYSFGYYNGVASINVDAGTGYASFRKLDYALNIGNLTYITPALFYGQGIYKSSDNNTVIGIWENRITYCTKGGTFGAPVTFVEESISSIEESTEGVYTISTSANRTYVLTLNADNQVVSLTLGENELTKVGDELLASIKAGAEVTVSGTTDVLKFTTSLNTASNKMELGVTKNGAFFDSGAQGLRVYIDDDGNVCHYSYTPFAKYKIYVNGEHQLVAEVL